jgi:outer membrane autotransporter protein
VVPTLLALRETKDLDQAYYNLSGGGLSAASTAANQISTAFMSQLLNLPGATVADDGEAHDWAGWARFFGGSQDISAARPVGAGNVSTAHQAVAIGFDVRGEDGSLFGVALSTGSTRFNSANGVRGDGDVYLVGLYGMARFGAGYVAATASLGRHSFVTKRELPLLEINTIGHVRGVSLGGRIEAGYRFDATGLGLTPYAAMQVQTFDTPRFGESYGVGAHYGALRYEARSVTDFRMEAGASADSVLALGRDRALAIGARAAWLHHWTSNPDIAASFAAMPEAGFRVRAVPPVADAALLSAGAELRFGSGLSLGARFEGEFAHRLQGYTGAATLRYSWR